MTREWEGGAMHHIPTGTLKCPRGQLWSVVVSGREAGFSDNQHTDGQHAGAGRSRQGTPHYN